ncbi:Mut7-C ubiquitin/RNAse domain-containing protein [Aliifodinibius salicampi]|uniref:Mut7-C ubiquitin/RNAse domain-containing protein n=1 Tax=Fodinibius salicampi TaxID=1920655 RepID=A0ABT3Q1Y6_9BACT|nr:Mut7-C RNAse domain-containing protein [Fodinibius salicampi]MCW9714033.1 Mut7-C ubiquitin/RNAse domain-containing protein [Fodinibius salicampi]
MITVSLRFYGDLNDLLTISTGQNQTTFERQLPGPTSVKDLIEGCGVPHTEVDVILVDSKAVDFSYLIADGNRISIYPVFNSLDIPEADRLQKPTAHYPRFLADVNLGKLARYLRLAGLDTAYRNDADDDDLIEQMQEENRVLLTRDRKLLMHKVVRHGYLPRSADPAEQLEEVLRRFDLFHELEPFSRCPRCNGSLQNVPKEEIIDRLEPLTKRHFDEFSQCIGCGQVYWAGSHRRRLDPKVKEIFDRI